MSQVLSKSRGGILLFLTAGVRVMGEDLTRGAFKIDIEE